MAALDGVQLERRKLKKPDKQTISAKASNVYALSLSERDIFVIYCIEKIKINT